MFGALFCGHPSLVFHYANVNISVLQLGLVEQSFALGYLRGYPLTVVHCEQWSALECALAHYHTEVCRNKTQCQVVVRHQ